MVSALSLILLDFPSKIFPAPKPIFISVLCDFVSPPSPKSSQTHPFILHSLIYSKQSFCRIYRQNDNFQGKYFFYYPAILSADQNVLDVGGGN
jgi:hypothetical protein